MDLGSAVHSGIDDVARSYVGAIRDSPFQKAATKAQ
jgi:hypothetical protein